MPQMNSGLFGIFNNLSVKNPNNTISSTQNPKIVLSIRINLFITCRVNKTELNNLDTNRLKVYELPAFPFSIKPPIVGHST